MSGPGESPEERQARLGRNEALFREVNERINDLNDLFAVVPEAAFEVVCECGDPGCFEQIPIQTAAYARVRADPTLFILVPGHENATIEAIVETEQGAYVLSESIRAAQRTLPPTRLPTHKPSSGHPPEPVPKGGNTV